MQRYAIFSVRKYGYDSRYCFHSIENSSYHFFLAFAQFWDSELFPEGSLNFYFSRHRKRNKGSYDSDKFLR